MPARRSRTWSSGAVSRSFCCSRSTSTRCTCRRCSSASSRCRQAPPRTRAESRRALSRRTATGPPRQARRRPTLSSRRVVLTRPINAIRCIAVVGAGSWGTALAIQLCRAGLDTKLWGRDRAAIDRMRAERRNARYLPEATFPDRLEVTPDLRVAVDGADVVLLAVPSHAFRATLEAVRDADHVPRVAWATKGFELDTGLLPHKVAAEVLGAERPTAVLSGPTFAREVAAGLPTALTIASEHDDYAEDLARALTAENLRPYTSSDIVGVEVGGATKNVFAIG